MLRDTNIISSLSAIPQAYAIRWYEPVLVEMLRKTREEIAIMIEETATELGLERFRSGVWDLETSWDNYAALI